MENDNLVRLSDVRLIESRPDAHPEEWNDSYEKGFMDAINAVLDIPAVDAVEVRHAYWTRKRTGEHDGELYCSACGKAALLIDWREEWKSTFCPWCGACMDGRREEGDNT